ncbi:MAG TPA: PEP-CTERM sorting domain-containing protein, partial [Opitutaceae bacterium]|nr:PEP-CTERM sorting domain-containing protein [Opitutaceae bacterium]
VTDGYVDMEPELFELVRANLGRASLFTFGIGSSVNRHLIEGLARAGHGEPFVVTEPDLAEHAAAAFREMIEAPVLTGIQVSADGIALSQLTPAPVPDLLASRPVVVSGHWQGQPTGTLTLRGNSGGGAWQATLDFAKATRLQTPGLVSRLVARERITELTDLQSLDRNEERRQEIIRLGIAHNLLTKYTSFVAIDEVVRRDPAAPLRTIAQPSLLPEGVSELAVGGDVATAPEPGTILLLASGALAAGASLLRKRRKNAAR